MSLTPPNDYTFHVDILVMGAPLPSQVMELLTSLTVDDDSEQADIFELRFRDTARTVLALGRFMLGTPVTIKMTTPSTRVPVTLMEGEITTLESEYDTEVGTTTVVRGFDKSHKLFRNRASKNYQMMKASDVVSMIAASNGLVPQVDATTTVYTHLSQANESDWQFLKRLARQAGRTLAVEGSKLKFKRPGAVTGLPVELKAGEQLLGIRVSLSTNEQVKKVVTRSYDPILQQPVTGQMPLVTTASLPGAPLVMAQGQSRVTQEYVASEQPYTNAGDAMSAAMALSAQIAEGYVELHGETFGNPKLRAGTKVKIDGMGLPFNGTYNVTGTRHVFNGTTMYTTEFSVTGPRDDSIIGLAAAAPAGCDKMHGVVVGVVTDNNDMQKLGRVKVKIPSLGDTFQTNWAPVVYPGAGGGMGQDGRGLQVVPEVGDHVVVAFEQGDVNFPYVLGGFYTSIQKPPHANYVTAGKVTGRKLSAQNGDHFLLDQTTGNEQIVISSKDGKVKVTMGTGPATNKHVVQIETDYDVVVKAGHDASVSAMNNVSVEAKNQLAIKAAAAMSLESQANLSLKGATVKIEGSGPVEVKGAVIKLN